MSALIVGVGQFAPTADEAANLRAAAALVDEAAARGARLVVLPEYASYFVDPLDSTLAMHAQDVDGPFTRALSAFARRTGVTIVAGLVERADDPQRVHNTVVAVDATGVLARYRKLHLYDAFGHRESDRVAPGAIEAPETFVVDGIRIGIQTCYDLRFPEVTRLLADAGVELVVVPAEWVRGPLKEHHWRTLLQARAIENTLYVAAADHPPPLGVGASMIVDPQGVTIAEIGTATGVAWAEIDGEAVTRVRRTNPALALRRFEVQARADGSRG